MHSASECDILLKSETLNFMIKEYFTSKYSCLFLNTAHNVKRNLNFDFIYNCLLVNTRCFFRNTINSLDFIYNHLLLNKITYFKTKNNNFTFLSNYLFIDKSILLRGVT